MERSKVIDVYKSITAPDKKIIAIPAPAIYGQFNATPGQILSAIKAIGFDGVVEVALGAEDTSRNEAAEFLGTHGRRETFHDHFLLPGLRGLGRQTRPHGKTVCFRHP